MNSKFQISLAILLGLVAGYIYHWCKVSDDHTKIEQEIFEVLENKSANSDGRFLDVQGIEVATTFSLTSIGFQIYKLERSLNGYLKTTFVPAKYVAKSASLQNPESQFRELYINLLSNSKEFSNSFSPKKPQDFTCGALKKRMPMASLI